MSGFMRRVGSFTLGTALSRVLGLVREQVFAFLFGAGMATDAFNVAFRIPNFLRDLLAENAFSAAFVPTLVKGLGERRREDVWRWASSVLNAMLLGVGVIVALMLVFTPQITRVIAWGFARDPDKLALTTQLARIMMPFLLFVALGAWAMAMLNSLGRFFVPAVAPGTFNLFSIVVPIATYAWLKSQGMAPILGMAWGVTIGALCQFLVQLPALLRLGFRYHFVLDLRDQELRRVLFVYLPFRALGLATWQVNFLVNTFLITLLAERSVTWLNYAYRVMHLPAGLFGVAIGSVALVELSQRAASDDRDGVRQQLLSALQLVFVVMLPLAAVMIGLAGPVIRLIYEHGRFTAENSVATSRALMLYSLGVWAPAAARCVASSFYALKDTRTPALTGLGAVLFNIGLNLLLMRHIGYLSFALGTALAQVVDFGLLYLLLRRKLGGLDDRALARLLARALGLAALAGLAAFGASLGLGRLIGAGLPALLLLVPVSGLAGLGVYYLLARVSGTAEIVGTVDGLWAGLRRRLTRSGTDD